MARTNIDSTYILPDDDGVLDPPASEASADTSEGNVFTNDGNIILAATNGSGASADLTVGFPSQFDVGGVSHPDKTITMPSAETWFFRFPTDIYGSEVAIDAPSGFTFYLIR